MIRTWLHERLADLIAAGAALGILLAYVAVISAGLGFAIWVASKVSPDAPDAATENAEDGL